MTTAIDKVHGQGDDDNTGDDMLGVGAVKTTLYTDVTKDVPAEVNSAEVQDDSEDLHEDVSTVKKPRNG